MSEWDKMCAGALYDPGDPDLCARRARAQSLMRAYNGTIVGDGARHALLSAMLGKIGAGCAIRAPFFVDYGTNVFLGENVFFNFNCILLDSCPIRIGDGTMFGPAVQLLTADHPRDPVGRASGLENGAPITIGRNVWVGGGAIVLPGITIGDDAIIGAGAVVTRDVEAGQTVAGNPARSIGQAGS